MFNKQCVVRSNSLTWYREMPHVGADFAICTDMATGLPGGRFVKLMPPLLSWIHTMLKQKIGEEFAAKVSEVLAMSPARDMEKNLKASLAAWLCQAGSRQPRGIRRADPGAGPHPGPVAGSGSPPGPPGRGQGRGQGSRNEDAE
jgi:hypothetical protein